MAISSTLARLIRDLPLPRGGSLLEIGEANWYGDCDPAEFMQFDGWNFDEHGTPNGFEIAKAFYEATFAPERICSIDFNGSDNALRHDLNNPLPHDYGCPQNDLESIRLGIPCTCKPFDVIINHGTAEHIFNIGQVFRTMHDAADVGALLIHDAPFTGWIDHGFYCLHPTLFYDLAFANNYEVVKVAAHEITSKQIIPIDSRDHVHRLTFPNNSCLFVALRKLFDKPFKIPMQGYYAGTVSQEAWEAAKA